MVTYATIKTSNSNITPSTFPHTAVFIGATAGLGELTLQGLARLNLPFKVYVIGRKSSEEAFRPVIDELEAANPKAKIIWIEGEISLLAEAKRICEYIKSVETSIDLLFMSTLR